MTMVKCLDCGREISSLAATCPGCGRPLRAEAKRGTELRYVVPVYEYRSKRTLFGLPLVHVLYGPSWVTGLRPARGIVAIGNIALGVFAFGGIALGAVAFGGFALGLICLGGIALGLALSAGGLAIGYVAVGGLAVGIYAFGGLALGAHTLQNDPELRRAVFMLLWKE